MNALNEVNKLIMSLNTIQRSTLNRSEEPESLTTEKLIVIKQRFFFFSFFFEFKFSNGYKIIKFLILFYVIVYINHNMLKN
jgi:hypothetical protein